MLHENSYLFDENLDPRFLRTMQRHYPEIDVLRVGDIGAPSLGMSDPTRTWHTSVLQMPFLCTGIPQNWKTGKIKLNGSLSNKTAGI